MDANLQSFQSRLDITLEAINKDGHILPGNDSQHELRIAIQRIKSALNSLYSKTHTWILKETLTEEIEMFVCKYCDDIAYETNRAYNSRVLTTVDAIPIILRVCPSYKLERLIK